MRKIANEELKNLKIEARERMLKGGIKAFINHDVVFDCKEVHLGTGCFCNTSVPFCPFLFNFFWRTCP